MDVTDMCFLYWLEWSFHAAHTTVIYDVFRPVFSQLALYCLLVQIRKLLLLSLKLSVDESQRQMHTHTLMHTKPTHGSYVVCGTSFVVTMQKYQHWISCDPISRAFLPWISICSLTELLAQSTRCHTHNDSIKRLARILVHRVCQMCSGGEQRTYLLRSRWVLAREVRIF